MVSETFKGMKPILANANVLLTEDNLVMQLKLKLILEQLTASTDVAENGNEALLAVQQKKYDLILMDLHMPDMDGLKATRLIRRYTGNAVPVIAITAYLQESEIRRCTAAGINDHIIKPFDQAKLVSVLEKYFIIETGQPEPLHERITHPWLNYTYLSAICNGDKEKMKRIVTELTVQLKNDLAQLEMIVAQSQLAALSAMLHYIKSSLDCYRTDTPPVQRWYELKSLIEKQAAPEVIWAKTADWLNTLREGLFLTSAK